jgi:hypothetical protein
MRFYCKNCLSIQFLTDFWSDTPIGVVWRRILVSYKHLFDEVHG